MAESRSEREAHIKDRAGWTITVIAALLAVNTYIANGISSSVLTNTIKANDTWNFYQAKSIKQTIAENARDDAIARKDSKRVQELTAKIDRYESDPVKNEAWVCVRWQWTTTPFEGKVNCVAWAKKDCSNRLYPEVCKKGG